MGEERQELRDGRHQTVDHETGFMRQEMKDWRQEK